MRHLCLLGLLALACAAQPPASTARAPAAPAPPAATAPAPEPAESPPPEPSELTGAVSEAEFARLHEHTGDAAPAPQGEPIEIAGDRAYLSLPKGIQPPLPALVVIHEWWGLNPHIMHWADRLAAEGYAAVAVDLYGGKVASEPAQAMKLMKAVDPEKAKQRLLAAYGFLENDARVKASRRGSIGWCFGGKWSLELALAAPDLDAAVVYYGHVTTDAKRLAALNAPLLAVFGNQDESIPPATVDAFEKALNEAGAQARVLRYDAPHAFANPSSARYVNDAASDAYGQVRKFLAKHLKATE